MKVPPFLPPARLWLALAATLGALGSLPVARAQQEVVLQYFNTPWTEIERRLPEIAEAGYSALWLPPPCKGASGGFSVGYDVYDRFDLGDRDQMGSVPTRYGTKSELLSLVAAAHRFGVRVYFDNVMAHTGGPLDDLPAGTLFPSMRGFVPEDFHLVRRSGGGWRKASDSVDYNDEWQVLNRNPFAWDIAQESPNTSFNPTGQTEGQTYAKWVGIRQPGQTWFYPDSDLTVATNASGGAVHPFADKEPFQDTGWGANATGKGNGRFDWNDANANGQHDAGEASEPFTDTGVDPSNPARRTATWGFGDGRYNMGNPVAEDVNTFLIRANRWIIDQTACDGFRLDAVKHVPSYFFGQQSGGNKDASTAGFLGGAQEQWNVVRGFSDWGNHRDSTYSLSAARDDMMFFGEHLGAPPNPSDYLLAGMRMANDDFSNKVGGFAGIGSNLSGMDQPGAFTFGVNEGVMYCLSHDNNHMAGSERPAAHAYMLTRAGLPIVYTDGYNVAGGPDYFPKPSYTPFLGQYGQNYVTAAVALRRDFIRGDQWPKWGDQDFAAWEFRDASEGHADADAQTTLLVMHARNYTGGQQMRMGTSFPAGSRLRNYSPYNGAFHATVGNDGKLRGDGDSNPVVVPSGGYFAFSWDRPEKPEVWEGDDTVRSIDILQNGVRAPRLTHSRKDGKDGDPSYAHSVQIPRVTDGSKLTFVARADGSAENILMRLDGGVDINSQHGLGSSNATDKRDNKPGTARDTFLGYEQMQFVRRTTEKFAATDTARNVIGSPGAETWEFTVGTAGVLRNNGGGPNAATSTATWAYHDPNAAANAPVVTGNQLNPAPQTVASLRTLWVKIGYKSDAISHAWVYYTTDGTTYPEGSAGVGKGTTQVAPLTYHSDGAADGTGTPVWYRAEIPGGPTGTRFRYKIGVHRTDAPSRFPADADAIAKKRRMETVFQLGGFSDPAKAIDAASLVVWPHNDFGKQQTGLSEGYHVLRTRAFLNRSGGSPRPGASIFKTNTQTFYYDAQRPVGSIVFPSADGQTVGGSTYGVVVRTDATVTGVQFNILDSAATNDSAANGNGTGNWAAARSVTYVPGPNDTLVKEWRFDYKGIPSSGAAILSVRLREASSSADNALSDTAGWFTTLTRTLNTGLAVNFRIRWPETDGTVVDSSYVGKVHFDKSLGFVSGQPVDAATMIDEFTVEIDGQRLPRTGYGFVRDETATDSALTFTFPNLYDGDPDALHEVRATHERGDVSLSDTRLVKAAVGPLADADGDGLPDAWENAHGLSSSNPDGDFGAEGDPDGDTLTNLQEFLAGLSPIAQDFAGYPVAVAERDGAGYKITFPAIAGRKYQLQGSTDLADWSDIGPAVTTTEADADFALTDPSPEAPQTYYRVKIALP